jgi:predicted esterase
MKNRSSLTIAALAGSLAIPLAIAQTGIAGAHPTQAAKAKKCPIVVAIGVGGDGASDGTKFNGIGPVANKVASFVHAQAKHNKLSYQLVPFKWTSTSATVLKPTAAESTQFQTDPTGAEQTYNSTNVAAYVTNLDTATSGLETTINTVLGHCPNANIVMIGFSQGAMAVRAAEQAIKASPAQAELQKLVGTILIGDGDRIANSQAKELGSSPKTGQGVRPALNGTGTEVALPDTTFDICDAGDISCDWSTAVFANSKKPLKVHSTYVKIKAGKVKDFDKVLKKVAKKVTKPIDKPKTFFDGSPGTSAPPATLGGYKMTKFGKDARPFGQAVSDVTSKAGTVTFDTPMTHLLVKDSKKACSCWRTWSNGFKGSVYWSGSATTSSLKLPAKTQAFYLYVEPDDFQNFNVYVSTNTGAASGEATVLGDHGAKYFGFYTKGNTSLKTITIDDGGDDFAIGEFGISISKKK